MVPERARAQNVEFTEDSLVVHLRGGRTLQVPLEWFPRLAQATADQLSKWHLIGGGIGIHWDEIDEDLSVQGLLMPVPAVNR